MFRELFKKWMTVRNINAVNLSKLTGVSTSTISSFLTHKRVMSNANLEKIMKALQITLVPIRDFKFGSVDLSSNQDEHHSIED